MKILIVGSGGREHAIAWKLSNENNIKNIYCAPGNAGISEVAECLNINYDNIDGLLDFAKQNKIDLTIVGPEVPLVNGIVDEFEKQGLKIFGPNKKCSQLEASKIFSKNFMIRHGIPTAKYKEYSEFKNAVDEIDSFGYPVVIKADGLAGGKGVFIAKDKIEAIDILNKMMNEKIFKQYSDKVIIEEFLKGIETSILAFVDNNTIIPMVSAKDHKRVYDNEQGLNTGGMGTFSPSEICNEKLSIEIKKDIIDKTLRGFKEDNLDYKGILFIGLIITQDGAKVLEYNVRFGDPETQSILFRLETDLHKIIESIIQNRLSDIKIRYTKEESVCVILASKGYPEEYEKEKLITGLNNLDEDIMVFHSGTKLHNGNLVTDGGRVLGITAKGSSVKKASKKVYENIEKINFEGMHYRNDIGI